MGVQEIMHRSGVRPGNMKKKKQVEEEGGRWRELKDISCDPKLLFY